MRTRATLQTVAVLATLCLAASQPAKAVDPNDIPYLFVSAGGPYQGTVGAPIEFDAGLSYIADDNSIDAYYWDWHLDRDYECVPLPVCTHTWHSAFSGKVRVHVFGPGNNLVWDEAQVTVDGPETVLGITLEAASTDLHVYSPNQRHVGMNYRSGDVDQKIPDSTYQWMLFGADHGSSAPTQTVAFPLYVAGDYKIKLVGSADEPFQMTVAALQDGIPLVEKSYTGEIAEGETISLDIYAACPNGELDMMCGELKLAPGLVVEPAQIELTVEPNAIYDAAFVLREAYGKVPLESVTLHCSHIEGRINRIFSEDIAFTVNNFSVDPGGEEAIHVRVAVPRAFQGKATGTITVQSASGVGTNIPIVVQTAGTVVPVTVGIGPYEGTVGTPILFDASSSHDPDGYIQEYAWDWDSDGHVDDYTMLPTIEHTWFSEFDGEVTFYVMDNDGLTNGMTVEVTVTAPIVP